MLPVHLIGELVETSDVMEPPQQMLAPGPGILSAREDLSQSKIILIGTSTGGPNALQTILPLFPAELPVGVLIVQHMPATFTGQLARRLDGISALEVKEAEEGDTIRPGRALIAPGDRHMLVPRPGRVALAEEPVDALHRPAVDVMAASAAAAYTTGAVGVIMTGMGEDGKEGMRAVKDKGGYVVAQDEATSVIYGMPRAVVEAGLADAVCPLEQIVTVALNQLALD